MNVLVVTGGIGSGKSSVCNIIRSVYGSAVYNADERAKSLYYSHPSLLSDIEMRLGGCFRDPEGRFAPHLLAERIFSDKEALTLVENMVFPALMDDFNCWAGSYADDDFVVFESAIILEKPQFRSFGDKLILVDAPFDIRLRRASERDSVPLEKIYMRMMNQPLMNKFSNGTECPEADVIIYNTGDVTELKQKTIEAVKALYYNNLN